MSEFITRAKQVLTGRPAPPRHGSIADEYRITDPAELAELAEDNARKLKLALGFVRTNVSAASVDKPLTEAQLAGVAVESALLQQGVKGPRA